MVSTRFRREAACARIDLQIRRVAEGSGKVADRLRREVLYYVAVGAPAAPQVQAVQTRYELSGLIPSAEMLSADVVRLQPLLREAREQLAAAKDPWLKAALGTRREPAQAASDAGGGAREAARSTTPR